MAIADASNVLAVHEVVIQYWGAIDGIYDVSAEALLTEDCFFKIDALEISGRPTLIEAIRARTAKAKSEGRATRHFISNIAVKTFRRDAIEIGSLLTVFSGYGDHPMPIDVPSSIGDFTYGLVRTSEETWKISRIEGTIVFAGSDSPFAGRNAPS